MNFVQFEELISVWSDMVYKGVRLPSYSTYGELIMAVYSTTRDVVKQCKQGNRGHVLTSLYFLDFRIIYKLNNLK